MIRLHHVPFTRSFRVLWLLEELGLDYELSTYKIGDGSLRNAEFKAKAPLGRVPALEMDDPNIGKTMLTESGAICQVLAEREGRFGCRPTDPDWPRYLELISFAETMANQVEQLNIQLIFLRPPARPSEVVVKINLARLKGTFAALETMLGDRDWLLDSGFSVADMMMGFNMFAGTYFVSLDQFPRLKAYRDRIEARPKYRSARGKDGEHEFYLPQGALDAYRP